MKYQVEIGGVLRNVEIEPQSAGAVSLRMDDKTLSADIAEMDSSCYSILIDGRSFEARVSRETDDPDELLVRCAGRDYRVRVRDPRAWRAGRGGTLEAVGPQRVLAPMPGR